MQLVSFSLGGFDIAVEAQRVKDVLRPRSLVIIKGLSNPKGMPSFIEGFVETNMVAVPVVDLRKRFSIHGKKKTSGMVVIVLMDKHVIGLSADDFGDLVEAEANEHLKKEPLPFDAPEGAVFVALSEGKKIFVIIPERLFSRQEKDFLTEPIKKSS
ncbi:MAG: chemotaxis protein CheW [Deltaproteobacteria bacterium]|nr:chemotaxis protein CheW [Deltaproteobacteria bacterium]